MEMVGTDNKRMDMFYLLVILLSSDHCFKKGGTASEDKKRTREKKTHIDKILRNADRNESAINSS